MSYYSRVSTGWDSLDRIIDHLRRGDNVVWQVDAFDDYQRLAALFANSALSAGEKVVYIRFARHMPILEEKEGITVYKLKTESGFESFSTEVHAIITREGRDVFYIFDMLSDLLHVWATDLMIGDFFYITCPYLYELNTIAYFGIQRDRHSFKAIARIRETTQLLIDVYAYQSKICIHPIKVQHRYSPTMFFPHIKRKDRLEPVINSVEATEMFSHISERRSVGAHRHLDYWDRLFIQAEALRNNGAPDAEKKDMVEQLSRLLLSRDKRIIDLVRAYMSLEDFLEIKQRLIGTGYIGGKSLGMLLARRILTTDQPFDTKNILENHDSFYIGSDVFYSYIVQNGWWKLFMGHKTRDGYFSNGALLKEKLLTGAFPDEIREQFQLMLEYFGQSPIIVRSSSLLEDAFGSAFAGKYDSFFCVNQDSPEKRYDVFEEAVKLIFASMMNEDALAYRLQRGLDQRDEQMALLVQRVSGSYHQNYFFPEFAGVGLSRNPFAWKKSMDEKAGMLRLVFGLGTRAVNRVENDYPRIVALDHPLVKPLSDMAHLRKFSQRFVDLLKLDENRLQTMPLSELKEKVPDIRLDLAGVRDFESEEALRNMGRPSREMWVLTFDNFLTETPFVTVMGKMLECLENGYDNPVDIEFTVNFTHAGRIQVNLLQCRPFQPGGPAGSVDVPENIDADKLLIRTGGDFMGGNVSLPIASIIYVDPDVYISLSVSQRYSVARLVGKLNKQFADREKMPVMLLGPGRWGTHSPEMGVPVTFSEINNFSVLGEISYQDGSLVPDLSFGSHFFQDLIETRIFYLAIYPEKPSVVFNTQWITAQKNILDTIVTEGDPPYDAAVKVIDTRGMNLYLRADIVTRRAACFFA
ncbi:MAG: PEP/pyruvate-binding domain-containing protein [Desulfosalsimonadaceae bacterium]